MTRRLVLSYLTVAVLVLLCLEIPLGWLYGRGERERAETQLEHSAEVLAAVADETIRAGHLDELDVLATETAGQLRGRVVIVDRDAGLLTSSHPLHPEEADPGRLPEVRAALRGHAHVGVRTGEIGGVESMSVAVPTKPGATVRGAVRVTVPTSDLEARITRLWWSLGAAGAAVLAVVTVVGFALARWISRPVHALERATRHLADGTLSAPASTSTGPPELRRLAATFNHTADRLQRLIEAQRTFAGHASHQIRTPLAALRLRLENLEADVSPDGRATLAAAVTETDRLGRMVEVLLTMARLEEVPVRAVPVDLDAVLEDRARMWQPLLRQRRVRLVVTGDPVGPVRALPDALEQVVDNLLTNALNVAPEGSSVTVGRHRHGDRVEVHVVDEGPGMGAEHRRRAFDRFWRAPTAPKGGTGLGLALVRQLVEAGGGRVELRSAPGGGVDAVVRLVAAPAVDPSPATDQDGASVRRGLSQASAER